jgi:hypothetical protein
MAASLGDRDRSRLPIFPTEKLKVFISKRKARMRLNPAADEAIKISAKAVDKRRIAKAAKEAIVPKRG